MQEFISEEGLFAYSKKYMKEKISNYFGDKVVYSSSTGKKTIVTLKNTVKSIIRKCFSEVNTSAMRMKKYV